MECRRTGLPVSGVARIALILDSVGALVGLWEPIELNMKANGHG